MTEEKNKEKEAAEAMLRARGFQKFTIIFNPKARLVGISWKCVIEDAIGGKIEQWDRNPTAVVRRLLALNPQPKGSQ